MTQQKPSGAISEFELLPDEKWLAAFRAGLLDWYRQNGRPLPWKEKISPYRVWISEIMLQQTQVGTVLDTYFNRFVEALPDAFALADASEQTVLQLWEGLGYYSRARNLHKAAKILVEQYSGAFPQDVKQVQSLPGIGRYTAGAILSISMDLPVPILEANTVRIHARLLGIEADPTGKAVQNTLWSMAEAVLPKKPTAKTGKPGEINQALMQFGQQVCKKNPDCQVCPLSRLCRAYAEGRQGVIPFQKPKSERIFCDHAAVVVRDSRGRIFLRQNGLDERWSGLWDFVRFEVDPGIEVPPGEQVVRLPKELPGLFATDDSELNSGIAEKSKRNWRSYLRDQVRDRFRIVLNPDSIADLTTIQHSVTKYKITLHVYTAKTQRPRTAEAPGEVWILPTELDGYPLSSTGRKIAQQVLREGLTGLK